MTAERKLVVETRSALSKPTVYCRPRPGDIGGGAFEAYEAVEAIDGRRSAGGGGGRVTGGSGAMSGWGSAAQDEGRARQIGMNAKRAR